LLVQAPLIETERLVLRGFRRDDLDAMAAILGDPIVVKHLTGTPMSREDSFRRMMMALGQWPLLGFGYWAVELKSDGRLIGQVGFADFERAMTPDISGEPEMGWIFDPSVHGQGIAHESCVAALGWADASLNAPGYPAIISLENTASIRLAERLGFERLPDGVYRDEPIAVFRRPSRAGLPASAAASAASAAGRAASA
jgi:RimJ/RimL family protein N-acetyltransferase